MFSGTLTYQGEGVPDKTVYIYETDELGKNHAEIAYAVTDATGYYETRYQASAGGPYYYVSGAEVP